MSKSALWTFGFVAFLALLACSAAENSFENGENANEAGEDSGDDNLKRGRCKFFCFYVPPKNTLVEKGNFFNLTCSHLIYGFAHVNSDYEITHATNYDKPTSYQGKSEGNFQRITALGHHKRMKVLFGVKHTAKSGKIENSWAHNKTVREIVWWARFGGFDGIFLDIESQQHLLSRAFEMFMKKLAERVAEDFKFYNEHNKHKIKEKMIVVLGVSARWSDAVRRKVIKYEQYLDLLYLWSDDIPTATSQSKAVQVDPLSATSDIAKEDTIKYNAEKLASSGIKRDRIIIGFTGWARSYVLDEPTEPKHGSFIVKVGEPGNITQRNDGRLAYHELCKVEGFGNFTYDNMAMTTSFSGPDDLWYSFNSPGHESLKSKLKWVSSFGLGGVGVFSVQSDDEFDECGHGSFPLHKYISEHFRCSVRRVDEDRGNEACTRLCSFNPDRATNSFSFSSLDPNWCSHIVLSPVSVQTNGELFITSVFRKAVIDFNAWNSNAKPYLLLSIGPDQQSSVWRMALSDQKRGKLIASMLKLVDEFGADGVDISWTQALRVQDSELLSNLLSELRANVTDTKQLFVSVSYQPTFANRYEFKKLSEVADYVILQGYRFHSHEKLFTGHHSPLFISKVLTVPSHTIEGMTKVWISNQVEPKKLIVALSAEALTQIFSPALNRAMIRSIGDPAIPFKSVMTRSNSPGIVTQTELCRILQKKTAQVHFIDAIGVPYMTDDNEFIAYDDVRSMQIKSVWISMKKFGGIALHGMELDNIAGECPPQNAFPMLKAIARSQVCDKCLPVLPAQNNTDLIGSGAEGNQTEASSEKCSTGPKFKVICSYKLASEEHSEFLAFDEIPYEQCDEIVIESFNLNSNGDISYNPAFRTNVDNMVRTRILNNEKLILLQTEAVAKKPESRFIAAIQCFMTVKDLEQLFDKTKDIVERIFAHLEQHNFVGVELDCSHLLRKENKQKFADLLTLLQEKFESTDGCPKTLSLRIPPWQTRLKDFYDLGILNRIHSVVLPPSHVVTMKHSMMASPLFTDSSKEFSIVSFVLTSVPNLRLYDLYYEIAFRQQHL
ncbi:glycosyl hydrolases family 18 domain-containing protein [Ditylenchus destructor]|uniref:Glycosyl hydrolases family 18 domain-containing protein n=1 Tax=Ditylenchus destructor TaxID=166010 RepID=A0AAD4RCT9_9BILA|nr:glycosyl hydrolases family 18 domain-containing protein [Ditylenchus destructor]